jgi:PII-like signaling protein
MQGSLLRFYVHEGDRRGGHMVWEWLLEEANKRGLRGGSVFRAMAGFGRAHVLHERKFFELAGSQILKIEFIVTDDEARELLALVHREKLRLFFAHIPVQFGVIDPTTAQPPALE